MNARSLLKSKSKEFKNMKKFIAIFAVITVLSVTTIFTSTRAFGDHTGLGETFEQITDLRQDDSSGLWGRFKQRTMIQQVLNRIADRLNLTDQQKTEIRQIIQNEVPVVKPILLSGLAIHQQFKELGTDGVYNQQEVNRLAALQATNARLLIIEKEKVKAQIFAVLTPEQRAEALEIRDEFEAKIRQKLIDAMGNQF